MTEPLCMWMTANAGTCIQIARDLPCILPTMPRRRTSREVSFGRTGMSIGVRAMRKGSLVTTFDIDETLGQIVVSAPAPAHNPLGNVDAHLKTLGDVLWSTRIHQTMRDEERLSLTDQASDAVALAGGAIAHSLGLPSVMLCAPNPWNGGCYRTDDETVALPEEWRITLSALFPPLCAVGNQTIAGIGDAIDIGPHWQLCGAQGDTVATMRLHARAADASSARAAA